MKSPRSSWLITIGLAAVSVGYLYFVFLPARRNIDALRNEFASKQADLAKQPTVTASLATAESDVTAVQTYLGDWRKTSPTAGEMSATYGAIYRLAKSAGVQLEKFDPQPVADLETVRKVSLTMNVTGTFSQIHAFLRGLEGMAASPWLEKLRIERGKDAQAPLAGELNLVIFAANPEISD